MRCMGGVPRVCFGVVLLGEEGRADFGNVVCMVYGIASSKHLFKDDEHLNSRDLELDPFLFAFRFLLAQKVMGTCRNFIDSTRPLDPQPLPLSFAALLRPATVFAFFAAVFSTTTAFSKSRHYFLTLHSLFIPKPRVIPSPAPAC